MKSLQPFNIIFQYNFRKYKLLVKQIELDDQKEKLQIGFEKRHMIIETNRPLLRDKGLKKKQPNIKMLTKGLYFGANLAALIANVIEAADGFL